MVKSQKELINISIQNITEAFIRISSAQQSLKEAGLYNFSSAIERIKDSITVQAKDLQDLNK
jgi:hypothetical protein